MNIAARMWKSVESAEKGKFLDAIIALLCACVPYDLEGNANQKYADSWSEFLTDSTFDEIRVTALKILLETNGFSKVAAKLAGARGHRW